MPAPESAARLARSLGTTPAELPPVAAGLRDEQADLVADLVAQAVRRRGVEIEQAVSDGLTLIPRPLRKPVLKLLGVGR